MDIKKIKAAVIKFAKDEEGLTVVEYAVAGGLIAATTVAAFKTLGVTVTGVITGIDAELKK